MKVESISGTFVLRSFFLYSFTILPFLLFLEITTLNSNKIIKAGDNSNRIELFDKVKQERNRKKKKDIQVFPMIERQQIPSSNKKPKKIERESKANEERTANSINIKNPWKLDAAIHLIHTECVHHWYYYLREIANFSGFLVLCVKRHQFVCTFCLSVYVYTLFCYFRHSLVCIKNKIAFDGDAIFTLWLKQASNTIWTENRNERKKTIWVGRNDWKIK